MGTAEGYFFMAKGISINIGLNFVDSQRYGGWEGKLRGCVHDADDMYAIAEREGFQAQKLINEQATCQSVIQAIRQASVALQEGDILFVSYAGHGGTLRDESGDEYDGQDETWCLFDGQLIDDELLGLWTQFKAGVRVLVISDSCHSGTITKNALQESNKYTDLAPRAMPLEVADQIALIRKNAKRSLDIDIHPEITWQNETNNTDISATVRLISACQDNQLAYDDEYNGYFTSQLKRVWGNGRFGGNYTQFHRQILSFMPAYQSPNHMVIGQSSSEYEKQRPFQI